MRPVAQRPHIAVVVPTIDQIGGAERQALLLAQSLAARSWQVTVIALSGSGAGQHAILAATNVAFFSLQMRRGWIDPRGWSRYLAWAARNKPDLIHSHLPHATWFARWVRLLYPVRVLVDTIHTTHAGTAGRRLGYRLSEMLPSHTTCVSAAVASAAIAARIVAPAKNTILPNGVPLPLAEPSRPANFAFRWIAVGRLSPVKNYPALLRAFAGLQDSSNLAIAGSGPEEADLRGLAAALGIEDRVQFAGFHSDIQPLLAGADAFVLTSHWEGLPVSVLEAQAAGLPVVATDVPGVRDAMLPGQTGLLVPPGDIPALAQAMSLIASMPSGERLAIGAAGRRLVQERFSLAVVTDRWERLYTRLLEAHPHRARWS